MVPSKPTRVATLPIIARYPVRFSMRGISRREASSIAACTSSSPLGTLIRPALTMLVSGVAFWPAV